MRIRKFVIAGPTAVLFAAAAMWAQNASPVPPASQSSTSAASAPSSATAPNPAATQNPSSTNLGSDANDTNTAKKQKEKHWSGDLVDVSCMVKTLQKTNGSEVPSPATGTAPPAAAHFADEVATPQGMPRPGSTMPAGQGEGNPNTGAPGQPNPMPSSGVSQAQQARMAKEEKIDNAAKACAASPSTQSFGLAMSGGRVVQFDRSGNAKAAAALKASSIEPAKKVKAKVAGIVENAHTVSVATIEIKGKRRGAS